MKHILILFFLLSGAEGFSQITLTKPLQTNQRIIPAAERMQVYLPLLKNKTVGVFANHTSMVGNKHLVDTLMQSGIKVKAIFSPEHGFRGTAEAGEKVGSYVDKQTGIQIISLYGGQTKTYSRRCKGYRCSVV